MNRRFFFSVLSALGLGAFLPAASESTTYRLHPLFRLENGRWVRRRMRDLVIGDKFRMDIRGDPNDPGSKRIGTVTKNPVRDETHPDPDGGWGCECEMIGFVEMKKG